MEAALSTTVPHCATESVESSPKSSMHHQDWDNEPLPPVPGAKLRLMCSYGGHIIPRPNDKNLCYIGGETRIVVAERNSSLSDLITRLSHSLLDGRRFTLKYQLPNEDLDSLISVSTDEDLENMIEEYERITAAKSCAKTASRRLRLFLFLAKPETAQTMGALFDDAQSETWFVDALNGADLLSRGLSESAGVGDLLRLDSGGTSDLGMQVLPDGAHNAVQPKVVPQDAYSIQSVTSDSPVVENTSSFDSSTSSPSMAHLPPIRVRVDEINDGNTRLQEEMKGGRALEEQFSGQLRLIPPLSANFVQSYAAVANTTINGNDSNDNCVMPDEACSEHGLLGASRKPPLPLSLQQRISGGISLPSPNESKHAAGFNLPSPDSVKSDSSIASGISLTNTGNRQDQGQVTTSHENKPPSTQVTIEQKSDNYTPPPQNQHLQLQPTQDPTNYIYAPQQHEQHQHQQQHQFMQENMHYIPTHPQIPQQYRPVYATPQQIHPRLDHQQYPMYLMPVAQTQPYNVAQAQPPVYPTRAAAAQANNQYQHYLGYNAPMQQIAGNPANYGHFDYNHNQVYYTGQLAAAPAPVGASQYQSITPAQAAMIAEASKQLPTTESTKQMPTS